MNSSSRAAEQSSAQTSKLRITVAICTRDRAAQLEIVLKSAAGMRIPAGLRWELLIVDNGSSDATAEVAIAFSDRLPIRVVREEAAGLSNARNRAVAEALGEYICWTDDDVLIDRDWLSAYAEAFAQRPDAAVFGGRILPVLERPSPAWFVRLADRWPLATVLARKDLGPTSIPLDLHRGVVPWGANFAVRTRDQRLVRYEASLGVSPHQKRLGEEAEVIYRILNSGAHGWWVPDAVVQHIIPVRRQSLAYVYDYYSAYGETAAYLEYTWPSGHHFSGNRSEINRLRGAPTRLYAMAAFNGILFGAAWLLGAKRRSLQFVMRAGSYVGAARMALAVRAQNAQHPGKQVRSKPRAPPPLA